MPKLDPYNPVTVFERFSEQKVTDPFQGRPLGTIKKFHLPLEEEKMTDEVNEKLKEISAELYCVKVAARSVDNPDIIDNALTAIIREIDSIVDEEKEKV